VAIPGPQRATRFRAREPAPVTNKCGCPTLAAFLFLRLGWDCLLIALQRYEGTVLLVIHDHDLIDEVATRIWAFHEDGIEDFQGPYVEWKGKHN